MKRLGLIKIISVRREPLNEIDKEDCIKEGFPDFEPEDFIDMLVKHYNCLPSDSVTRIEFCHL